MFPANPQACDYILDSALQLPEIASSQGSPQFKSHQCITQPE
jgi:hypothetical protein